MIVKIHEVLKIHKIDHNDELRYTDVLRINTPIIICHSFQFLVVFLSMLVVYTNIFSDSMWSKIISSCNYINAVLVHIVKIFVENISGWLKQCQCNYRTRSFLSYGIKADVYIHHWGSLWLIYYKYYNTSEYCKSSLISILCVVWIMCICCTVCVLLFLL